MSIREASTGCVRRKHLLSSTFEKYWSFSPPPNFGGLPFTMFFTLSQKIYLQFEKIYANFFITEEVIINSSKSVKAE